MSLKDLIESRSSNTPLEEPSVPVGPLEAVIPSTVADEGSSSGEPMPIAEETSFPLNISESVPTGDGQTGDGHYPSGTPSSSTEETDSDAPFGVSEQEHPSGICVYFQAGPKRLYRLRGKAETPSGVSYTDWKEVPSVSDVLGCLDKPALPWWGMKIGVEGVQRLNELGELFELEPRLGLQIKDTAMRRSATVDEIIVLLTKHKLTVNHVRDKAGNRGTNIHTALELWAERGVSPQVGVYAPEEQGYVQALADFLIDSGAEAIRSEVMVGSIKHKYAGRYDLEALIPNNAEVVIKTYPKRKPIREHIEGGIWLVDLKTSKSTYKSHALQLAAYEAARVECGLDPTVAQGVLHVTEDGRYELVRSKAKISHFRSVLSTWKVMQRDIL